MNSKQYQTSSALNILIFNKNSVSTTHDKLSNLVQISYSNFIKPVIQ